MNPPVFAAQGQPAWQTPIDDLPCDIAAGSIRAEFDVVGDVDAAFRELLPNDPE